MKYVSLKKVFLVGSWITFFLFLWWSVSQYLLLNLSLEDTKMYQIRREISFLIFLATYIAWRVTPDPKQ